jgi:hypothetical protein
MEPSRRYSCSASFHRLPFRTPSSLIKVDWMAGLFRFPSRFIVPLGVELDRQQRATDQNLALEGNAPGNYNCRWLHWRKNKRHRARAPYSAPLILSLKTGEHLNVTTLLPSRVKSPPVAGFLPLLGSFSLTTNFPNPLIRTSSPDSRDFLIISKTLSTRV